MGARDPSTSAAARARVLFVGESASLAHLVRLKVLARTLDPLRYEVWFAASDFDPMIFGDTVFRRRRLASISAGRMAARVARGQRPYGRATLRRYVRDELAVLEDVQPHLVVGDLRLSLAVSAPKCRVPYAALINAYWSPYGIRQGFPMPEHPLLRLLGHERVAPHFDKALPFVFAHFAAPINALRERYGLRPVGDLLEVLTYGDLTLYPDLPELTPVTDLPVTHHFIGPVLWAPSASDPWFWHMLRPDRPCIYVTLGSSGHLRALRVVLDALRGLPVQVMVATAGRMRPGKIDRDVWVSDFLPGDRAARRSDLVICNGGSATGYQALSEGVPVLGIPSNLDQYLAMTAIERAGAGELVRSGRADVASVRAAVVRLLGPGSHREAARRLGLAMRALDPRQTFPRLVDRAFGCPGLSETPGPLRDSRVGAPPA